MKIAKYTKAIIAASAGAIAVIWAVATETDPDKIPGMAEAIIAIITTLAVYVFPNKE